MARIRRAPLPLRLVHSIKVSQLSRPCESEIERLVRLLGEHAAIVYRGIVPRSNGPILCECHMCAYANKRLMMLRAYAK